MPEGHNGRLYRVIRPAPASTMGGNYWQGIKVVQFAYGVMPYASGIDERIRRSGDFAKNVQRELWRVKL